MYFITTKRMLEVCFFQHTPTFIIEPFFVWQEIPMELPVKQKGTVCLRCALARRWRLSQATALGARMCRGTFFFCTHANLKIKNRLFSRKALQNAAFPNRIRRTLVTARLDFMICGQLLFWLCPDISICGRVFVPGAGCAKAHFVLWSTLYVDP